jgi:pantothenate synthetase
MKIDESVKDVQEWLKNFPEIELDYLKVLGTDLLNPGPGLARVLVAAKIGDVRLIDNIECEIGVGNV